MTAGPRLSATRSARVSPPQREQLRRLVRRLGRKDAARLLAISDQTLERAADPHEILYEKTVLRLVAALERLASEPDP